MSTNAEPKLQFKPRVSGNKTLPEAPEGGWDAHIPIGSTKVTLTQKGDPQLVFTFKLVRAHEAANARFQGAEIVQRSFVPDDNDPAKVKGANMQRGWRRGLAAACGVDYDKVWAREITSEHSFDPFIKAVEGRNMKIYTTHSKRRMDNGEEVVNIDVRFNKPGASLAVNTVADDNPDRPSAKKR